MSFVKQAAILAAATLFARFIGFLYRLPLTNLIGDEGNALYGVGFQFYAFLLVLSSAGIPSAVSKMVSERVAQKEYTNAHAVFKVAMLVAVVFGTFGSLLLWTFAGYLSVWFGYPGSVYAIRAVSPAVLVVAIMAVYRGYFQGMNNTVPTALSQIIEQVVNAIFKIWLAYLFIENITWAAAGATASTGIGAFLGLITLVAIYHLLSPRIKKRIRRDRSKKTEDFPKLLKELLYTTFPIVLGTSIYSIANFIDMAMIAHRLAETGIFSQQEIEALYGQFTGKFIVITTLPVAISSALSIAILPSIAGSNATRDRRAVVYKIGRAFRLSSLISVPSAIGLAVMAEPILLLLFPNHPEGAVLLQFGAISIVFLSMVQVSTGALQGMGKIAIPVIAAIVGTFFKIPLNHLLIGIPEINVLGAVISTVVCYFLASLVNVGFLVKFTGIKFDWVGILVKPFVAAFVMGLACYVSYNAIVAMFYRFSGLATLISIAIGVVVYFLMLALMKGLHKEDADKLPVIRDFY
ncbi:MAG: polysaccharide biosynthesis protein [Turicibacter sp.]|nr:polysaccharide biosynthesis protein [Turicibacter sp.]